MENTGRPARKSNEGLWLKCSQKITNTSRLLNKFGWNEDVTAEYVRHLRRMGCSPEASLRAFDEIYELTGDMPSFKEVAEKAISPESEVRHAFGQGGTHLAWLPMKILLCKKRPGDPNEPIRYAMCYCGCESCRPDKPPFLPNRPEKVKGYWEKRADELAPFGKKGFAMMLEELSKSGNPLGRIKV